MRLAKKSKPLICLILLAESSSSSKSIRFYKPETSSIWFSSRSNTRSSVRFSNPSILVRLFFDTISQLTSSNCYKFYKRAILLSDRLRV